MFSLLCLFTLLSNNAEAEAKWYFGTVDRIWPYNQDGGFIITFTEPSSISDCAHGYAYFTADMLPPEMMKNSMSVALSAFHSEAKTGVIIDKGQPGESCLAKGIDLRK